MEYTSDQLNYMPSILKSLNPSLYPDSFLVGNVPGLNQSIYDEMIHGLVSLAGFSLQELHLGLFVALKFLALLALYGIGQSVCDHRSAWLMVGIGLTAPWVYGTEIRTIGTYLTPRLFATVFSLVAFYYYLENRPARSSLFVVLGVGFHPVAPLALLAVFGFETLGGFAGRDRPGWITYTVGWMTAVLIILGLRLLQPNTAGALFFFRSMQPLGTVDDLLFVREWHPGFAFLLGTDLTLGILLWIRTAEHQEALFYRFRRLFAAVGSLVGFNFLLAELPRLNLARIQLYRSLRYLKLFLPLLLLVAYQNSHRRFGQLLAVTTVFAATLAGGTVRMVLPAFASVFALIAFFPSRWISLTVVKNNRTAVDLLAWGVGSIGVISVYWQVKSLPRTLVVATLLIGSLAVAGVLRKPGDRKSFLYGTYRTPFTLLCVMVVLVLCGTLQSPPNRSTSSTIKDVCEWVRKRTEPQALIYYEPARSIEADYVRIHCRRKVFFSRKTQSVKLINRKFQQEWNRRSQLVNRFEEGNISLAELNPQPDYRLAPEPPETPSQAWQYRTEDSYQMFYLSPVSPSAGQDVTKN